MSSTLRKEFYEYFARTANEAGIAWTVLSGVEGYPLGIGRDLDVACKSRRDADLLCKVFVGRLHERDFRWVVHPSPIWGRRILGIAESYAAVELHIVDPVRIGSISLTPAWDALEYEGGVFPIDPLMRFFKRCLMPALTRSPAWRRKCSEVRSPPTLPWWMRSAAQRVRSGRELTGLDRVKLFSAYSIANPVAATANFLRWRQRWNVWRDYPAAPVYRLNSTVSADAFLALAKRSLSEVFTGFACGDDRDTNRIRALQAAQRLVFLSRDRSDLDEVLAIPPTIVGEAGLLEFVVEEFARFNKRWGPEEDIGS